MRIRRRTTAVLTVSLAAHALLLTAYLATHPPPNDAEPPVIQVELLRPRCARPRPAPAPRPANPASTAATIHAAPPVLSQPAPPSAPAIAAGPRPLDTRRMTDQELLERAGSRPDLHKLYEEEVKRPVFSRRLPPGPFDCKPADEHSDRIAPPCPNFAGLAPPSPVGPPPNRPAIAAEAARQNALKAYKDGYGSTGMAKPDDYPGLRCALLHTHC